MSVSLIQTLEEEKRLALNARSWLRLRLRLEAVRDGIQIRKHRFSAVHQSADSLRNWRDFCAGHRMESDLHIRHWVTNNVLPEVENRDLRFLLACRFESAAHFAMNHIFMAKGRWRSHFPFPQIPEATFMEHLLIDWWWRVGMNTALQRG